MGVLNVWAAVGDSGPVEPCLYTLVGRGTSVNKIV